MSSIGCCRSSEIDPPSGQEASCFDKTLTKAALFVLAFLFAGGSVGSYWLGWGLPGIVSFGAASGLSLIVFSIACARNCRESEIDHTPVDPQAPKTFKKGALERMSFTQLVSSLPSPEDVFNDPSALETRVYISDTLGAAISKELEAHISVDNKATLVRRLQPLFSAAGNNLDRLEQLCYLTFRAKDGYYLPIFLADLLETLVWDSSVNKVEVIARVLGSYLLEKKGIYFHGSYIERHPSHTYVYSLGFDQNKVLGGGNFIIDPLKVPDSLIRGIANAFLSKSEELQEELRQKLATGLLAANTCLGIEIKVSSSSECRISTAILTSLLSHLHRCSGLLSVSFRDVGLQSPFDNDYDRNKKFGLSAADIPTLIQFVDANPYLREVELNDNGMDSATQQSFRATLNQKLEERLRRPVNVAEMVSHEKA